MTLLLEPPTILAAGKPPLPFEVLPGSPGAGEHDAAEDQEPQEEV